MSCLAVVLILSILGIAATAAVYAVYASRFLPDIFFAPPEHCAFAAPAQRAAVALTRLTILESAMLPLLLVWASQCFRRSARLGAHQFYEKYRPFGLAAYRIGFVAFFACSAAVAVGATSGQEAGAYGLAASLIVYGCLSWLAWTGGKRLMAFRWPFRMSDQETWAFLLCILPWLLMPVMIGICYGTAILTVSQYLVWLGPFGWVNSLLLGLGMGQTRNLWPLGIACAAAVYLGYRIDVPTATWAFRRRLVSIYRTPGYSRGASTNQAGEQRVARDLRQSLLRNDWRSWKSILWPRWIKGHTRTLLLFYGTMLLFPLILAGLVLFVEAIEARTGLTLNEKQMLCSLMSSGAVWAVLLLEGFAAYYRDQAGLRAFARRPVSAVELWKQLQSDGLRFVPTQALFAIPLVILTIVVAPGYAISSCLGLVGALSGCIAIRTTLSAGSCYYAATATLPQWMSLSLQGLGLIAAYFLIPGTVGSVTAVAMHPDWTPTAQAACILLPQIATLTAFGLAWGLWYTVGRSRHEARLSSSVG